MKRTIIKYAIVVAVSVDVGILVVECMANG